ncbi:MAG: hypothetical protein ACRD96_26210 [Bryobacteraceae bacterium]
MKFLCLTVATLLILPLALAQDPGKLLLQPAERKIAELQASIPGWSRNAGVTLTLTLVIGVAGFVSAFLQAMKPAWDRKATAMIGLVVGITTFAMEKAFVADHRGYRAAAATAKTLIERIETQITLYSQSPELVDTPGESPDQFRDRHVRRLEFFKSRLEPLLGEITALELRMASLFPLPVVYAADKSPGPSASADGVCNILWQAQELSYNAAVDRLADQLKSSAGPVSAESLREYVRRFATRYQTRRPPEKTGLIRFTTQLRLDPLFASAGAMRPYLMVAPQQAAPPVAPARLESKPTFVSGARPIEIPLVAPKPSDGHFQFLVSVDKSVLVLESLAIHQDSSAGSTRWGFVILANDKQVLEIPIQRFDDSARPTRCQLNPDSGWRAKLPPAAQYKVQIVGFKPKDL